MVTTTDAQLIRQSWAKVTPIADAAAQMFYQRLFARDPDLADLFATTDMAAQRRKLVDALDLVIARVDHLGQLAPALAALGQRHRGYGARAAHYDTVGAALLDALAYGLGGTFTDEVRAAWTNAYATVAAMMQATDRAAA